MQMRVGGSRLTKAEPYVPLSHSFVERLIGTVRMEYLDRTLFWTTVGLENKLLEFRDYFNSYRAHHSLEGNTRQEATTTGRESNLRSMATSHRISCSYGLSSLFVREAKRRVQGRQRRSEK
jgi:hypothetical protein